MTITDDIRTDRPNRYVSTVHDPADAVTQLHEVGYAVIEGVLSPDEVSIVRDRLSAAAAEADARGVTTRFYGQTVTHGRQTTLSQVSRRVYYLPYYDDVFIDLARHPFAVACVNAIIPNDFVIGNFGANMLENGSGAQELHRDQGFKLDNIPGPSPDPPLGINVGWAVDDMTFENGATVVIPGSHRWDNDRRPTDDDERLSVETTAGSAVLIDGRTWHGAGANITPDSVRSFIFGLYTQTWVRPHCNWNRNLPPFVDAKLPSDMRRWLGIDHGLADIY